MDIGIDALGGYDPYSASKACAEIITDSMRRSFFHPEDYGASGSKGHSVLIATARAGNVIGGGNLAKIGCCQISCAQLATERQSTLA